MDSGEVADFVLSDLSAVPLAASLRLVEIAEEAEAEGRWIVSFGRAFGHGDHTVFCLYSSQPLTATVRQCVNIQGERVSLDESWQSYSDSRVRHAGALSPRMEAILDAEKPSYDALVWPRLPAPVSREDTEVSEDTARLEAHERQARAEAAAAACHELADACEVVSAGALVEVRATARGLRSLARSQAIGLITPNEERSWATRPGAAGDNYLRSDRFNVVQLLNPPWNGEYAQVAVIEGGRINPQAQPAFGGIHDPALDTFCTTGTPAVHADGVGSVVAADSSFGNAATRQLNGSAPNVRLLVGNIGLKPTRYCASSASNPTCATIGCSTAGAVTAAVNWARLKLVDVVNYSNEDIDPSIPYTNYDRFLDWVGNQHPWPVLVPITGQIQPGNGVTSTGCFNCLVVGGTDDKNTFSRVDDISYSSMDSTNRLTGLEVPHVVAPAVNLRVLEKDTWKLVTGTSYAAPQVSGLAASIVGLHPDLKSYPEAVRALIMASATQDIDGVSLKLGDSVDDQDGAGEINAYHASQILIQGGKNVWNNLQTHGLNFGALDMTNFGANGYYNDLVTFQAPPSSGFGFQTTMVWNVVSTCSDAMTSCPAMDEPLAIGNYSIELYRATGFQLVAQSATSSVSHNYVHMRVDDLIPDETYYLFIKKQWENPAPPGYQYFGLAWNVFLHALE